MRPIASPLRDREIDSLEDMDSGCRSPQTHMNIVERDRSLNHRAPSHCPTRQPTPYGRLRRRCQSALASLFGAAFLAATPALAGQTTIAAFGDSLSAGYQLPADAAFPAVLQAALRTGRFRRRGFQRGGVGRHHAGRPRAARLVGAGRDRPRHRGTRRQRHAPRRRSGRDGEEPRRHRAGPADATHQGAAGRHVRRDRTRRGL